MKKVVVFFLAFLGVTAEVVAQDEEYYNYSWYQCELGANQTEWTIKSYKEGMSWINVKQSMVGRLTFSDDCVEIYVNYGPQMHFPVKEYKRISEDIFCITRNGEDDYFDYIEVIRCRGREQGLYRVLLAMQDPDGTLQNTKVFICKPKSFVTGSSISETLNSQRQGKENFPPQVPKK